MAVPSGALAKDVGPRKVDPVMEPGSSFVVVNKTHGAQSQESLLISANRALKLGRYDAAMEMYDSLYAKNKKDPAILMGRAVAYQKAGRSESAIQMYEELLTVDKNNGNALLNMLGLLRTQYPETALRRLMNLREQYPGNASIAAQIGLIEADLGHPDEALRYLGMAASIEPRNAQHYFNMAIVADRKGDKAGAIKLYEQALEADAVYGGGRSIAREQIYDRLAVLRRG
jgi:tetratricopeptide (TPR) repeat protein